MSIFLRVGNRHKTIICKNVYILSTFLHVDEVRLFKIFVKELKLHNYEHNITVKTLEQSWKVCNTGIIVLTKQLPRPTDLARMSSQT